MFFGEMVVGDAMPNLTFLLVFLDDQDRNAAWRRFRDDREWLKLTAIPEDGDKEIVSRITNVFLVPVQVDDQVRGIASATDDSPPSHFAVRQLKLA